MQRFIANIVRHKKPARQTTNTSLAVHSTICHQCSLRTKLPKLNPGLSARCPRCNELLCSIPHQPYIQTIAWAISTLIFLILSCCFPFLSMNIKGNVSQISLLQSAKTLTEQNFTSLATLLLIFVVLAPALFIFIILYLYQGLSKQRLLPGMLFMAGFVKKLIPWMMVDVFFLGSIVSMIKLLSYATISFGWSFWAFLCFTITLTRTSSLIDSHWLYAQIFALQKHNPIKNEARASISCHVCGFLSERNLTHCQHCQSKLHQQHQSSLQITLALLIAAVILYFPANLYPMMLTNHLGSTTSSTILQGVILLWDLHSYPVAAIIFIASICIPIAKMISLSILCFSAYQSRRKQKAVNYTKLYRVTEFIGRWSMIDVFVVSILVSLVHMGSLMSIYPGSASLSFASVVILTMLSARSFDVRLIWDKQHDTSSTVFESESPNEKQ